MGKKNGVYKKGRAQSGPFLGIPRAVLESEAWRAMSGNEAKLLLDVGVAYRGTNNGNLSCTWAAMHKRGWASRETLARALKGIIDKGFLVRTRQGGRRVCSLYALTWEGIHECGGKLDVQANPVPSNAWKNWQPQKIVDTVGGSQ